MPVIGFGVQAHRMDENRRWIESPPHRKNRHGGDAKQPWRQRRVLDRRELPQHPAELTRTDASTYPLPDGSRWCVLPDLCTLRARLAGGWHVLGQPKAAANATDRPKVYALAHGV